LPLPAGSRDDVRSSKSFESVCSKVEAPRLCGASDGLGIPKEPGALLHDDDYCFLWTSPFRDRSSPCRRWVPDEGVALTEASAQIASRAESTRPSGRVEIMFAPGAKCGTPPVAASLKGTNKSTVTKSKVRWVNYCTPSQRENKPGSRFQQPGGDPFAKPNDNSSGFRFGKRIITYYSWPGSSPSCNPPRVNRMIFPRRAACALLDRLDEFGFAAQPEWSNPTNQHRRTGQVSPDASRSTETGARR